MRKSGLVRLVSTVLALACASASSAATQLVDGSGRLTGATGVNVGGTLYDVQFVDGTCSALFSGCDGPSDFIFQDSTDAVAAGDALFEQVFTGIFDSNPGLTSGCSEDGICEAIIPYSFEAPASELFADAINLNANSADGTGPACCLSPSLDTTSYSNYTYAVFTLPAAVPEPATWLMMIFGFGGIGGAMRASRRRPKDAI